MAASEARDAGDLEQAAFWLGWAETLLGFAEQNG
jgi:hypothetical protein